MRARNGLIGFFAVLICVAAGGARGADLGAAPEPPAVILDAGFSWTGLYIGANAGGAAAPGNPFLSSQGFGAGGFDLNPSGRGGHSAFTGGLQGGYNYQIGRTVFGVETDFEALGNCRSGTFATPGTFAALNTGTYTLAGGCSNYYASLRGRLGYAFDRMLVYGTAGFGEGGNRDTSLLTLNPSGAGYLAGASHSARTKYIVGGGLEYALTNHWFARAEYEYVNLGRIDQIYDNGAGQTFTASQYNQNHIVRLGLDYRFGEVDERSSEPALKSLLVPSFWDAQISAHGQFTWLPQGYPSFHAAYSGPQSLSPQAHVAETSQATVFLGLGLWKGASIYIDPEIDEGFGVQNTYGIAGFPNTFAYKVGKSEPYERTHRFFLRQVIGLGGGREDVENGPNQVAGPVDTNRLTLTIGKYSVVDIFDDNKYAHDPVNGFINWTIIDMGAFDYAADAWGYTYGATAEWKQDWWTARAGVFQLSVVPNSIYIEPSLFKQSQAVVEFEDRYAIANQPGKLKFLFFASDAYLGSYNEALAQAAAPGVVPDITAVRARRVKTGGGVNLEQQITPSIGMFARASLANGQYETEEFTEVERSLSGGTVINGDLWGRAKDQIGIGGVLNGISQAHVNYLAAGGLGLIIGDGGLSYSGERIIETYYKYVLADGMHVSADYQFVDNPGYNTARGPVSLFALKFHAEF